MATTTSLATSGNNLALEITHTFPPKYWKKENYENLETNKQYLQFEVHWNSTEFYNLQQGIMDAQYYNEYYDEILQINRIQNPYSYARFLLRKKYLLTKYGNNAVYQARKYKLIREKYADLALEYNCDMRRFGKNWADYRFFDEIPEVWRNYCLIVVQQLSVNKNYNEDYSENYNYYYEDYACENSDYNECNRDSEFYIEYVVYFDV